MSIAFVDAQVLMWPKGKTISDVTMIREQNGGLYKLKAQPEHFVSLFFIQFVGPCFRVQMLKHDPTN